MKEDTLYLAHILDCIGKIQSYTRKGRGAFLRSAIAQDAVVRKVIGEAVRHLSVKLKQEHPRIPWREIAAFRNRLIHEYFKVRWTEVWRVVEDELPALQKQVSKLLAGRR